MSDDDEVELHEQDTLAAGAGLCDQAAVHALVEEGPGAIQELILWGAEFDREGSKLLFALEAAHSRSRVLHSHGDSTGREMSRALYRKAASLPNIRFQSFAAITDLLLNDGVASGALACDAEAKAEVRINAGSVLLATGGIGHVFQETTNPDVATGDGVAAAYRAGAVISDIEFVQFHPTALFVPGAPRFLLTEALRGEGAYILNAAGERFMANYDARGELAARDVVSRSILLEMRRTGTSNVFLDLRHLDPEHLRQRFPRVYQTCLMHGVDITAAPVPVHPAAHYAMGGVRTDLHGLTSIAGLYAAGETACTGVHGANRLASNSLLEGLVFGARAGDAMVASARPISGKGWPVELVSFPQISADEVRSIAWEHCGVLRTGESLSQAIAQLAAVDFASARSAGRAQHELRSVYRVVELIARCAYAREESRGGHYRLDYPETRSEFQKHSAVSEGTEVRFE